MRNDHPDYFFGNISTIAGGQKTLTHLIYKWLEWIIMDEQELIFAKLVWLIGDNCITDKLTADLMSVPLLGCQLLYNN